MPVEQRRPVASSTACDDGRRRSARSSAATDGVADPPARHARARPAGARSSASRCARNATRADLDGRRARDRVRAVVGRGWRGRAASSSRCARSAASCCDDRAAGAPRTTCRWCSRRRPASTSAAAATGSCSAMTDPEPRWGFEERVDESLFADRLERLRHRYPPAAEATIERRVGRALRHDPRRAPDPRRGRRRRLRGLRLLRPRLHAVARGRARAGGGDPRREPERSTSARTASSASRTTRDFPETLVL